VARDFSTNRVVVDAILQNFRNMDDSRSGTAQFLREPAGFDSNHSASLEKNSGKEALQSCREFIHEKIAC
jgi:hypothetical protein